MRYAIISDIHANEAALRAVLTDAADARAEKIVCLGDVMGYGPDPVSTLELVYRRVHVCLAGNHDDAITKRFPTTDFTPFAAQAVERQRTARSQEAIEWLRRLPHVCEFPGPYEGAEGAFACAHGEFADPKHFNYVLEPEEAMPSWLERSEQLLFVGHSHKPGIFVLGASGKPHMLEPADFVLEPNKRYLVNVGSVGYPRSGACRSFYCIYDDLSRSVFFRSLPFDLEAYRARMNGQGLDEAPWMRAREKARGGHDVRSAANFSKETSVKEAAPVRRLVAPRPLGIRLKTKKAPAAGEATVKLRTPQPLERGAAKTAGRGLNGLVPAILAGAVIVAAAGLCCTHMLVKSLPDKAAKTSGDLAVARPPRVVERAPDARFSELARLPEGWSATFEKPSVQKVSVEANLRREATAFRLTSETSGTIRLTKRLALVEKPAKLYWTVALLSTTAPGKPAKFAFNVRIEFFDAHGRKLGESLGSGQRSATNKSASVPAGTAYAIMDVDCTCEGTYDLAIPYFRTDPDERRAR